MNKTIKCFSCGWLTHTGDILFKVKGKYICVSCLGFYTHQDVDKIKEEEYQRGKDEQMHLDKIQYGEKFKAFLKDDDRKLLRLEIINEIKKLIFKMHDHEIRCVDDNENFIGEFQTERPYIDSLNFEKEVDKLLKEK